METQHHMLPKYYYNLALRYKFIIPAIAVIFISFLIFSIYFIQDQRTKQEDRLQEKAERISYLLLSSNLESIWDVDLETLERNCQAFFEDEELTRLLIIDTFYGEDVLINLTKDVKGTQDIIKTAYFTKGDQKVAKLEAVFSNYYIEQNLVRIRNTLIVLSVLIYILMTGLIIVVSQIALTPLGGLMKGVQHLRSGDLSFRIPLQSQDELGKLAGSFNDMADELSLYHDHLQELVDRRTAELKTANEHLHKAKKGAEDANRAKSTFLANISHELRTPLNAIIGFSELMTRDPGLSPEQVVNINTIIGSGEHLLSLINDVLELSKIEAGQSTLHEEDFDLHRLLLALEEMFRLRSQQKRFSLEFEKGDDVPQYIRADQSKLRQILINLLDNAVKFTETGRVILRVTCSGTSRKDRPASHSLRFEVADTGVGIAREEQDKVFDAFFQTVGRQSAHQGTGLGLPISQRFVSMMGGSLELHSEVGSGTKFSFDIPAALADGSGIASSQPMHRVTGLAAGQPVFRILVVEDNDNSRNLLVKLLQAVGFTVQEAVNGREALDIWDKWHPHLIWMDIRMPVMDGYQATERIKTSPAGNDTVIIALTASAFEEDRMKYLEHGGNDFIRKPFREYEIFEMISKHLGVTFVYEAQDEDESSPTVMSENQMAEAINQLPEDLRRDFLMAVDVVDFDTSIHLAERVREQNELLGNSLAELVKIYQFDTLHRLFGRRES